MITANEAAFIAPLILAFLSGCCSTFCLMLFLGKAKHNKGTGQ